LIASSLWLFVAGLEIDPVLCSFFFSFLLPRGCNMLECDRNGEIDVFAFVAVLMAAVDLGGNFDDGGVD
jgi:hypothetical protein